VVTIFRVLAGVVDGVNVNFETPAPYYPGSVRVFVDGQLKMQGFEDGWIELGYNRVQLLDPPEEGSTVQAYFWV